MFEYWVVNVILLESQNQAKNIHYVYLFIFYSNETISDAT